MNMYIIIHFSKETKINNKYLSSVTVSAGLFKGAVSANNCHFPSYFILGPHEENQLLCVECALKVEV